jgi:hypothetical protein
MILAWVSNALVEGGRMKSAVALATFLAAGALAQSENEHGVRTGPVQTAYLIKPVEVTLTASDILKPMDSEREAQVSAGRAPVKLISGKQTRTERILPPLVPSPRVVFETWAEQLGRQYGEGVLTGFEGIDYLANRTAIHRFVRDNFRHVYAAYTFTIEPLPDGNSYRATLASADPPHPADVNQDWKIVMPPRLPVPQIANDGDTIPVLLYEDAKTGERLVDYIHVLYLSQLTMRQDAAHSAYSDDAEFNLVRPRLRINGVETQAGSLPESQGQVLSIDIPGRGRFTLSFKPLAEFERMGEVSGNSLTFFWNNDLFRIDCSDRIASSGSASYHVYVRH